MADRDLIVNKVRTIAVFQMVIIAVLSSACGSGCGGNENVPRVSKSTGHLKDIALGYMKATESLGYPPRNKDELIPFLKRDPEQDDPERPTPEVDIADLFRSPTDDQDYVILWGVDYREYDVPRRKLPVFAYEKTGKDGKREVAQGRYVHTVTDEQLANLPFPNGVQPP